MIWVASVCRSRDINIVANPKCWLITCISCMLCNSSKRGWHRVSWGASDTLFSATASFTSLDFQKRQARKGTWPFSNVAIVTAVRVIFTQTIVLLSGGALRVHDGTCAGLVKLCGRLSTFRNWRIFFVVMAGVSLQFYIIAFSRFRHFISSFGKWPSNRLKVISIFSRSTILRLVTLLLLFIFQSDWYPYRKYVLLCLLIFCRSAIRIRGLPEYVLVDTVQILHCTETRYFWITWRYGTIEVGRGQEFGWDRFMAYQPLELYTVEAVGYSTGFGVDGTWIMTTDYSTQIFNSSRINLEVMHTVTVMVRLKSDLLIRYFSEANEYW